MPTFARELEQLIRAHLGTPRWGDDFFPVLDALNDASLRIAMEADRYRFRDDSDREWQEWQRELKRREKKRAGLTVVGQ